MSIYKRGNTWYVDYYVEGKRRREAVGNNRKLAESILAKRKVQVAENRFLDIERRTDVTFDQLAVHYMEYAKSNKRSWDRDQRSIMNLGVKLRGKRLYEITPLLIEKYKSYRSKQVSPASVNRELACLKHMFTKAIERDLATSNPVRRVKLFRESPGRVRYLKAEEIHRLLDEIAGHLRPIVILALYTGMRKGEVLNLRWGDIDFRRETIHIQNSKSGYSRDIPMAEPVLFALQGIQKRGDYIFCNPDDSKSVSIKTGFTNALRRAGIKGFTFHDLRHTFASHLVMNGTDLLTVKELLGHRSINMTLRYSHLSPEHKTKAVTSLKYFDGHNMLTATDTKSGEQS